MLSKLPHFIRNINPEIYLEYPYTVLDFEIAGGRERGHWRCPENRLILACWKTVYADPASKQHAEYKVHWGSEFDLGELAHDISRSKFIVAHNAKFELGWLSRCGVETRKVLPYCTMLGEYVLAGNRQWALSLDATSLRYGGSGKRDFVAESIKGGVDPDDIPRSLLEEYCLKDVKDTDEIFIQQVRRLADDDLLRVAFARNIVCPVLADIETQGMVLEHGRVILQADSIRDEYKRARDALDTITGGINPRSSKQLS